MRIPGSSMFHAWLLDSRGRMQMSVYTQIVCEGLGVNVSVTEIWLLLNQGFPWPGEIVCNNLVNMPAVSFCLCLCDWAN